MEIVEGQEAGKRTEYIGSKRKGKEAMEGKGDVGRRERKEGGGREVIRQ